MQSSTILAKSTILLVDDNPANLAVLTHALAAHHVRILVAEQGEAGLQIATRARPDLILLDVQLPGADGFEICRRLKADPATAEIPVLFMTVRMEPADKLRGFQAGAVDYITKPFQSDEVLARVTTHLRLRQLSDSLRAANEDLEQRVHLRTAELVHANAVLQEQIAERQRVEEVLVAERNLLRALIDHVPDHIFVKDTAGRFVLANPAMLRFAQADTGEQLLGKTDFDFLPAQQAEQLFAEEQIMIQSGQPLVNHEETTTPWFTDVPRLVLTTKVPVRDAHGEVTHVVGISRDISERKRLEDALAAERNLLRALIDNVPDNIFVKDTASRFVLANPATINYLGVETSEQLLGKTDFDFFPAEQAEQYFAEEQSVFETGQPLVKAGCASIQHDFGNRCVH